MTTPTPPPTPGSNSAPSSGTTKAVSGKLAADTMKALVVALATEQAALWAYGIVAAYDQNDATLIQTITDGHGARRDNTIDLISSGGGKPVGAAAAYQLPVTVTDANSARALAYLIETDCGAAWRAVVGTTDDANLRTIALQGLSDSANWLTRLKIAAKTAPSTIPFPGQPG